MRLAARDRQILAAVQLNAAMSLKMVARLTGHREHTVRHVLQRLKESGVIQRRPMTDVHLMGFTQYSVFFTPFFEDARARDTLLKFLLESSATSDIFELGGDYRYGAVLTVLDIQEVYSFLSALSKLKGIEIIDKSFSTRISTTLYRRDYLSIPRNGPTHVTYRRSERRVLLDSIDKQLLTAIHLYPESSLRDVAGRLMMPHTTVAKRIRDLEQAKIILGYVYGIASQLFGMTTYRLIVHTKGFDYDSWQRLFKFALQHPNILCLFQCIGSWDYEFEVEVENQQEIASIVQQAHEFLGSAVISIKLLPILSFPKSTGFPFSKPYVKGSQAIYIQ